MNIRIFKLVQLLIKYGLAACTLIFVVHVGLLLSGISTVITEAAFGLSWYWAIILYLALIALRFCNLSKAFFIYCFFTTQCMVAQRTITPFGDYLTELRVVLFAIGVCLLTILLINFKQYITCVR